MFDIKPDYFLRRRTRLIILKQNNNSIKKLIKIKQSCLYDIFKYSYYIKLYDDCKS